MKGKYRDAGSAVEIESILAEDISSQCIMWQNIEGERVIYSIKKIEKSEDDKLVTFQIKNYQNDFILDRPVYVKLKFRGTMFRSSIAKLSGSLVTLNFPLVADVKTIELREEVRINFDLSEERFITIGMLHNGKWNKEQALKFQLLDISESGVCVLVTDENKNYLQNSKVLAITHLGSMELSMPVFMIQKYASKFRYRKNGKGYFRIRIGFKLKDKIKKEILAAYLNSSV